MKKPSLILKYFQKKDQLTTGNRKYQQTISTLFKWLIDNDNIENDTTTKYFLNKDTRAIIIAKQNGIIAGLEETGYLLEKYTKLVFNPKIKDGSRIHNKETIAQIKGYSREILGYERTILNILQRMSGIATETNRLIKPIHPSHHTASITNSSDRGYLLSTDNILPLIAATRKTPWMSLDKKAVSVGGGLTHRLSLSDGILIKDNHLANITIQEAVETVFNKAKGELIEIEVENFQQAHQVITTFQKLITTNYQLPTTNHLAILLDNFSPSAAQKLLSDLPRRKAGLNKNFDLSQIIFEVSGGITEENIMEWAKTGVDIISLGSLTHSTRAFNLSLEIIT